MAEMETIQKTKIEIMLPETYRMEAEEFTDFFESMTMEERVDLLKTFRGAKLFEGIMKTRRVG